MENMDLRLLARGNGVPLWKIAEQMHISEPTLTRWLRQPLTEEKKEKFIAALETAKNMRTQN